MANCEKLEQGGVLSSADELTPQQVEAIESLSDQEIQVVLANKQKPAASLPPHVFTLINTHHMPES